MPAWVRSFILALPKRVAATTVGAFTQRDSTASEREDVVLRGGGSGLRVCWWIQPEIMGKGPALPYSSILEESGAIIWSRSFITSVPP